MSITAPQAAATPVFAATSAELVSGAYLVPVAKVGKESKEAKDGELGKKLWEWTEGGGRDSWIERVELWRSSCIYSLEMVV